MGSGRVFNLLVRYNGTLAYLFCVVVVGPLFSHTQLTRLEFWLAQAVRSRLQLFASPPPMLIMSSANEPCRLVLRSAVNLTNSFCGL